MATSKIRTLIDTLTFRDVAPLLKELGGRQANVDDLTSVPYVRAAANAPSCYEEFESALPRLRGSVLKSILRYEWPLFKQMFWIHLFDVVVAIFSAVLSVQLLKSFEAKPSGFTLAAFLFSGEAPQPLDKFLFGVGIAVVVFLLNLLVASMHAQKIEREMLLVFRIHTRLVAYLQQFVFCLSRQARFAGKTPIGVGDITNLGQTDALRIALFFAHAMVDFPVLFVSVGLIATVMYFLLGPAAYVGLAIISLQIPISSLFSYVGERLNQELMKRSDARMSLVTEWLAASRVARYFGWGDFLVGKIQRAANREFRQEVKLKGQFCFAFSLSTNWSQFVCLGMFAGFLVFETRAGPAEVFGSLWLASILGHQLNPLPWFVNILAQARVGSQRIGEFLGRKTQQEEMQALTTAEEHLLRYVQTISASTVSLGFSLQNVSVQFEDARLPVLENFSVEFKPGELTAIKGTVGKGKSVLLQVLCGDILPSKGKVLLNVFCAETTGAEPKLVAQLPLHAWPTLQYVRQFMSYVPQEAFVANATLRENVPLVFQGNGVNRAIEKYEIEDSDVLQSLFLASLEVDLRTFPDGLNTEIGERGVNLSGGQKQRLSMARSAFAHLAGGAKLILLDDPLSAVDQETENALAEELFEKSWKNKGVTVIWTTHRLAHLGKAQKVVNLDDK